LNDFLQRAISLSTQANRATDTTETTDSSDIFSLNSAKLTLLDVYVLLTQAEGDFFIGHLKNEVIAYVFSSEERGNAFIHSIPAHAVKLQKERFSNLLLELSDLDITSLILDPEDPKQLPESFPVAEALQFIYQMEALED
jgi:hypothetical protein